MLLRHRGDVREVLDKAVWVGVVALSSFVVHTTAIHEIL